jgi:hypothetical protein
MSKNKQYFFPPESSGENILFTKFPANWGFLAATYHNMFVRVFSPDAKPECRDSFALFPAMMLYRHSIELLLKAIYTKMHRTVPATQDSHTWMSKLAHVLHIRRKHPEQKSPTDTHSVLKLFKMIRTRREVRNALGVEEKFVMCALTELQQLDKGDGFRYGADMRGNPSFPGMPEQINGPIVFRDCERLWNALQEVHGPFRETD